MSLKKYNIITVLIALLANPILMSIGFIVGAVISRHFIIIAFILSVLLPVLVWFLYAKKAGMPEKASDIFLPLLIVFGYYMLSCIITFGCAGYDLTGEPVKIYIILTVPYLVINAFLDFIGAFNFIPVIYSGGTLAIALTVFLTRKINKEKLIFDRKFFIYAAVFVCLCGVAAYQFYDRI